MRGCAVRSIVIPLIRFSTANFSYTRSDEGRATGLRILRPVIGHIRYTMPCSDISVRCRSWSDYNYEKNIGQNYFKLVLNYTWVRSKIYTLLILSLIITYSAWWICNSYSMPTRVCAVCGIHRHQSWHTLPTVSLHHHRHEIGNLYYMYGTY